MPLISCKDCGREVSTRARHCVHCGRPWPGSKCCGALATLTVVLMLLSTAAVGGLGFLAVRSCRRQAERQVQLKEMERGVQELQKAYDKTPPAPPAPESPK